jgi:hypothetical protein
MEKGEAHGYPHRSTTGFDGVDISFDENDYEYLQIEHERMSFVRPAGVAADDTLWPPDEDE